MARVKYLDRDDLPEEHRKAFADLVEQRGTPVGNIFRTMAHTPGLLRRFLALGGDLRNKTKIDPQLRELAILTVGRLAKADYEFTHHWNLALRAGVPREKLEQLDRYENTPVFTPQDRAVIKYAEEATSDIRVSDKTFDALRSFLDDQRIVELVLEVAFYNMVVRFLEPLGVELEPGVKKQ